MSKDYDLIHKSMESIIETAPKPGEIYLHYKCATGYYKVEGIAVQESNQQPVVIYRHKLSPAPLAWSRPLDEWNGNVIIDGKEVKRFTKVDEMKI